MWGDPFVFRHMLTQGYHLYIALDSVSHAQDSGDCYLPSIRATKRKHGVSTPVLTREGKHLPHPSVGAECGGRARVSGVPQTAIFTGFEAGEPLCGKVKSKQNKTKSHVSNVCGVSGQKMRQ